MAQVKIVDIINPYQVAKDQKVTLENQLTAANATLAEKAPEIKTALTGLPSKSVFLLNASGKVTVYILDAEPIIRMTVESIEIELSMTRSREISV